MLFIAFIIFFIASIFGLLILEQPLKSKENKIYIYWHGPIALIGIFILATAIYYGKANSTILISLSLFIFSALIGLALFTRTQLKKHANKWLIAMHAVTGLIAVILLLYYLLAHPKDNISIYAQNNAILQLTADKYA